MIFQRTIKNRIETTGIGLHSGKRVNLGLSPAPANTGVVFVRSDQNLPDLSLHPEKVTDTMLCTALTDGEMRIATVEHLLSALAGMGVDNVYVHVDAEEIPIMDGSAMPFLILIQNAGVVSQSAAKQFIEIKQAIKVQHGGAWAELRPHAGFKASFEIDFDHPAVTQTNQTVSIDFGRSSYATEVAKARTFGFMHQIESLRSKELGLGGSFENAIVLDAYRVLNPNGLRHPDEFVRHKVLDAIGDLYTLGHGILGHYHGYKSGHHINNLLVRALLNQPEKWALTTLDEQAKQQVIFGLEPVLEA